MQQRKRSGTIAINGRFHAARITGVERYAHNVSSRLIPEAMARGYKVKLFVPKCKNPPAIEYLGAELIESILPENELHIWEQVVLPMAARKAGVDVLINLTNTAPIMFGSNILTLHDLFWLQNPAWFSPLFRLGYTLIVPPAARSATRVVTVSSWSAEQIKKQLQVSPAKLTVIAEGVGEEFTRPSDYHCQKVRSAYSLQNPYFLHVGTIQPRKNLRNLLCAYKLLCEQVSVPPDLVLVGGNSKHFAVENTLDGLTNERVKWLGYVPDEDLPALYANSLAYVSASYCEGFNLTILEAMSCGAPTLLSRIPPHLEVASDNSVFFEPQDPHEIMQAMRTIIEDVELRQELIARGRNRAAEFGWNEHVTALMDVVDQVMKKTDAPAASRDDRLVRSVF